MRKFKYTETNGLTLEEYIVTEQEILDKYFKTWAEAMWQENPDPYFITVDSCIEDWCITKNAEEIV